MSSESAGRRGPRLVFDRGTLVLTGLWQKDVESLFPPHFWTWDPRVSGWRCNAIECGRVRAVLAARADLGVSDEVIVPLKVAWPKADLPVLRPEQQEALDAWRAADRRGVVVMPTGTGKTEVGLAALAECGTSALIVAPVRDLMYQWHQRIQRRLGYDAGIVGDNVLNVKPVTVTTYDSAYIHMPQIGARFALLIFDEAHHLPGRCRREAALLSAAPMRLGLTATPERSDGAHADLAGLIGPIVCRQEIPEAKGRTLADYDVIRVPVALTPQEQARYEAAGREIRAFLVKRRKEFPKYCWEDLLRETGSEPEARRAQRAHLARKAIEDRAEEKLRVLEDIFRLYGDERVLVFAGSNDMAMDVSRRFLVPTILSHTRKRERREALEGFAAGRYPALVANQVLDEGVDVPAAKVAVVIGGHASTRQAKQRLGRILRKAGAVRATLYEVVCEDTKEVERSRQRRRSDAYERTRHRQL